ncbi:unnamed protein product [Toxocara canis]|uniref:Sushi domain-containing protein n=1 Tax=Toxocara canis TaxID=6265 RepID=A0A183UPT9_TOXCA|nr:unnamed protein product [Toxocara canis]
MPKEYFIAAALLKCSCPCFVRRYLLVPGFGSVSDTSNALCATITDNCYHSAVRSKCTIPAGKTFYNKVYVQLRCAQIDVGGIVQRDMTAEVVCI